MPANQVKFRKRKQQDQSHKPADARILASISRDISKRKLAEGLAAINQELLQSKSNPIRSGRLMALAADAEYKNARFDASRELYRRACEILSASPRLWCRPRIGEIRSALKLGKIHDAQQLWRSTVAEALARREEFSKFIGRVGQLLDHQGTVVVPIAPVNPCTLSSRIGHLFLQAGELEAARDCFQKALEINKRGGIRARQGLAKLAVGTGDADKAFQYAREAIITGKASAKTLACWPILIAARRKLGGWMIGEDILSALKSAPRTVRARAIVVIATEMRKHDMRQWQQIALGWLETEGLNHPVQAAEIKKMILASWKTIPGHAGEKQQAAKRLLQTPNLSRNEWLAGVKELVRTSLLGAPRVEISAIIQSARQNFDEAFAGKVRHSMALTCMSAARHDLARSLLAENLHDLASPVRLRSRSAWVLARMERALGNHSAAADAFRAFAADEKYELKFRLQARLLWVESMIAAGQAGAVLAARAELSEALREIADPELLMNFARQIRALTPQMNDVAFDLFDRAAAIAIRQFETSEHPALAMDILFKLARRMVCDFERHEDLVLLWTRLPASKREWLWQSSDRYWEFLGLLVAAYGASKQNTHARAMARQWLEDPSIPSEGRIHIGIALARILVSDGMMADALVLFSDLAAESPAHPLAAAAWYWLALEAHHARDFVYRNEAAANLRRALGPTPGLLDEWKLDVRALLLMQDLHPRLPEEARVNYTEEFVAQELSSIQRDLEKMP